MRRPTFLPILILLTLALIACDSTTPPTAPLPATDTPSSGQSDAPRFNASRFACSHRYIGALLSNSRIANPDPDGYPFPDSAIANSDLDSRPLSDTLPENSDLHTDSISCRDDRTV